MRILTIECAGLLVWINALAMAERREEGREQRAAIEVLQEALGKDKDVFVPFTGGVMLNLVLLCTIRVILVAPTTLIKVLSDDTSSGEILHGALDAWNAMDAGDDKLWLDYLCGNHSRNLPIDAFNKIFEDYVKKSLGSDINVAKQKGGRLP